MPDPAAPVVLLHAFPLDSTMFDGLRNALPGVDLITPDQRGFGGAPLGDDPPDLAVAADDVRRELDARGIDRAVIGGVSMGGYVALRLLDRHPERLLGLVLVDTKAVPDTPEQAANRDRIAAAADTGEVPPGADLVAPLLGPAVTEQARTVAAAIADTAPPAAVAWAQRAMAARPDSMPALRGTDLPVLVVVGEHDAVTPPEQARAMASTAGRSTLVELPGAGHLSPLEQPAAFAATLRDWIGAQALAQ